MKKKLFALFIMVAMLALVACSSDDGKKDKGDKGKETKESASEDADENIVGDNIVGEDDGNVVLAEIFEWEVQGKCVAITDLTEKGKELKEIVVPNKIGGKKVIAIEKKALASSMAEEVILPDTVKYIGEKAISYCPNLKKIDIPEGVEYIGKKAFCNNPMLVEINIPDSVLYVANVLFYDREDKMTEEEVVPDNLKRNNNSPYVNCEAMRKGEMPEYIANRFDIEPTDESYFEWEELEDGTVSVTGIKEDLKEVYIPETISGKKVACIDVFCSKLGKKYNDGYSTEVLIVPSGVVNVIGGTYSDLRCVQFCGELESLTGFEKNGELEAIVVPKCKKIEAFNLCGTVLYVELPEEMESLSIGGYENTSFDGTCVPALKLPKRLEKLEIQEGIWAVMVIMPESVGEYGFINFDKSIPVVTEGSEVEAYLKEQGIEYVY